MKDRKKIISLLLVFCMVITMLPANIFAIEENLDELQIVSDKDLILKTEEIETSEGDGDVTDPVIEEKDGYYYIDGVIQTGFITTEDGNLYYFDENDEGGKKFTPNQAGFYQINEKLYYFNEDNSVFNQIGICNIEGKNYYFNEDYSIYAPNKAGVYKVGGKNYYFYQNNSIYSPNKAGVSLIGGKNYYFYRNNSIYKPITSGKKKISTKYYYVYNSGVVYVGGWKKVAGKKYYFTKTGAKTGWNKINKKYYYFYKSNASLAKKTIIGKYYVNDSGVRVTDKAAMQAVKMINRVSKNKKNDTKEKKLKACYKEIMKFKYERSYEKPTSRGKRWYSYYANYIFTKKKGNCFKFAAAFAYCAKILGYDARAVIGEVPSIYGGFTPHGWVEIKTAKGTIYTYDPDLQMAHPNVDSYKITYKHAPYNYRIGKIYPIKL